MRLSLTPASAGYLNAAASGVTTEMAWPHLYLLRISRIRINAFSGYCVLLFFPVTIIMQLPDLKSAYQLDCLRLIRSAD
jgi:hypothetical protein